MKRILYLSILIFLVGCNGYILATNQDTTSSKITHVIGIDVKPGSLFHTHDFFRGSNNAEEEMNSTLSGHLKYGFKFSPNSYLGKVYPDAIQGVGIGYNTFYNSPRWAIRWPFTSSKHQG